MTVRLSEAVFCTQVLASSVRHGAQLISGQGGFKSGFVHDVLWLEDAGILDP